MKKIANEIKTGIMVVACILILLVITARVAGMSAFKKGYTLKVQFNYASGLKKGAPVYLTGVEAGEIKEVRIDYPQDGTRVVMTLWLDKSAKVRQDSKAYIATMGLMGEKYLELTSGSKDASFLKEYSLIVGKEPIVVDEVMDKAVMIADNLNAGVSDLRKLTKNVDLVITENRSAIDGIVKNMEETSKNFKDFSEDIKRHPWKVLVKTKEKKEDIKKDKETKGNEGSIYKKGD